MEGTRLRIVALLQGASQTTIGDLAKALDMAPASIRRHLDILQRDHLVSYRTIRQKPGRPEHAFSLTELGQEALPKRYQQLLQHLLDALTPDVKPKENEQNQPLKSLLRKTAHKIVSPYLEQAQSGSFQTRIQILQKILEIEEFAPAIESLPDGIGVHLLNCPFRGVAIENALVCTMDKELISLVLGAPATDHHRINRNHHHCVYRIQLSS